MPEDDIAKAEFGALNPNENPSPESAHKNLERLYDLPVTASVQLGASVMSIRELLTLNPGSVVELDRIAGESIDLFVNDVLVGKGEVVVINDNFGLRITEIVSSEERLQNL